MFDITYKGYARTCQRFSAVKVPKSEYIAIQQAEELLVRVWGILHPVGMIPI